MRPVSHRFRRARRGQPLRRSDLGLNAVVAVFFSMLTAAQGVHIYWDGTGSSWQAAASWSTLSNAVGPDPSAVPGATDIAHFNISTANSAQTVNLNGDASAMGLVVLNTSTTTFQGGGTNRIFTLGSDGITLQSGAGAVTIGSGTAGQFVNLLLGSSQFWTNQSANALTVLNGVNLSSFRLQLAGSGGIVLAGEVSGTGGISTTAGMTTLTGTNTYTGTTIVSGGTLTLDYVNGDTAKFAGALSLSGGTIDLVGGNYAQVATATTFGTGASSVTRSSGILSTLALGAISRTSGATANFTTGMASTTTGNTNGIVGPWATVGGADWAQGTTSITAYSGYTTLSAAVTAPTGNYQLAGSLGPLTNTSVYTLKIAPGGSGQSLSISSGNSLSMNGLLVTGTDAYSVTGGTLQPTTTGVAQELIVHQFNSGGLTISSVLANHGSGEYSLTKTGSGTLTLSGANTYTGATTVTAGGLVLSSAGSLADTSAVNLAGSSASFNLSGITAAGETIGSLTGLAGSTVVLGAKILTLGGDDSSPAAFPGVISGTGGVSKIGSGTQTFSGINTYSGATTVSGGTLGIAADSGLGTAPGSATPGHLTLSGGTLATSSTFTLGSTRGLTTGGTLEVAFRTTLSYGGIAAGTGSLSKTGEGRLTLSGANTYSGSTTLSEGILRATTSASALGSGALVLEGGTLELANDSGLNFGRNTTVSGSTIILSERLTAGAGVTHTLGSLAIGAQTLSIGTDGSVTSGTAGVTFGDVTLSATGAMFTADTGALLTLGAVSGSTYGLTVGGGGNSVINGIISTGTGTLTKSGIGRSTLSGANTFSGSTTLGAGTLRATTSAAALGAGALVLAGGTLELANDSGLNFGRNTTVSSNTTILSERLTAGAGVTHTLGTLAIGAQTLTVGTDSSVTSGTAGVTFGATTLSAAGATFTANAGALLTLGAVSGSSYGFSVDGAGNAAISGAITTGTGTVTKSGSGTLTLSGTNTYTGATTVTSGTLSLDYSTNNTAKFAGSLSLNGGTVNFSGGSFAQTATTSIGQGASSITQSGGTSTLALGAFTRSPGATLDLTAGAASTTTANVVGIVGPWVTVAGADWATGTTSIIGLASYTTLTGSVANGGANNYLLTGALGPINRTTINTLKITPSGAGQSLSIAGTQKLSVLGLLVTGSDAYTISGGNFEAASHNTAQELVIHQYNSGGLTLSSVLEDRGSGVYSLTKTGSGSLTLSGASTYTGGNTINQGSVILGNASGLGVGGVLNLNGSTANLSIGATSATVGAVTLANGGSITGSGGTLTGTSYAMQSGSVSAILGGPGVALTKTTAGTVALSGANSYTGATTISAGALTISHATALGTTAAGTSVASGTALEIQGGITVGAESLTLNGTGVNGGGALRNLSGDNTYGGALTLGAATRINSDTAATTLTLSGAISGSFGLTVGGAGNTRMDGALTTGTITKDGSGRLILNHANSYSGLTDIRNGVVEVTSLSALSGYVVRFGDASAGTDGSLVYNLSGTATQTTYQHFHFSTAGSSIVNIGTAPIDIHGTLHIMEQSILVDGGTAGITISSQILGDVVIRIAGNVYSRGGALATTGEDLDYVGASAMALDAGARFIIGHATGGPIVQTLAGLSNGAPTVAVPTSAAVVGFDPGMSTLDLMTMEMGPFIYDGTIGGSADTPNPNNLNLLKRAMGTQVLAGTTANTFTGLTKVSSGVLQLQKPNGIDAIGGNLEIQADALGQGTVKLAAGEQIPNTSTVIINTGGNLQFEGSGLTETVTSLTNNNGTFVTGANTFIGLGTAQTWNGGTSTVSAGGLLQGQSYLITGGTNTVQGGATRGMLEVQTGGNGLQFGGTSSPTLSLDSDASQAGSIQLTNNVTVLSTLTSGTARILSGGNAANPGFIDLMAATRTFSVHNGSAATDMLISASISNGGLTKTNAGTLQLSGVNTYAGITTVSAGTLQFTKEVSLYNNTPASWTAVNLVVASGASAAFNVGGTGEFTSGDLDTLKVLGGASNGFISGSTIGLDTSNASGGSFTYGSAIANPNGGSNVLGLTKLGAGSLLLAGTNTYTGPTTVSAGTLQFTKQLSLYNNTPASWTAANLVVASGATAAFNVGGTGEFTSGDVDTLKALGGASNGFISGSAMGLDTSNASGGSFTYGSAIANPNGGSNVLGLTKLGAGSLLLTGANTYTGPTTISTGTLQIGNGGTSGSLDPGSAIVNSATLVFNRSDTLTQGTGFGTITGTGTLTQAGSGTTILNGVNVVSGGTTVSGGSLLVGVDSIGSLASNVTVQNTGILGGSGTIDGTVTVASGGTYAPGNSPAIQTVTGDVSLGAGSIFEWELVANTAIQSGSAPYVYDEVNVGGTLSIDSTAILKIMLNTLSPAGTVNFTDPFWSTAQTWQVFVGAGTTAASFTIIQVSADSLGQTYSAIHSRGAFNYSSGSIMWTVPEVSSASVGVLLAAGLLRRQRVAVKRASA